MMRMGATADKVDSASWFYWGTSDTARDGRGGKAGFIYTCKSHDTASPAFPSSEYSVRYVKKHCRTFLPQVEALNHAWIGSMGKHGSILCCTKWGLIHPLWEPLIEMPQNNTDSIQRAGIFTPPKSQVLGVSSLLKEGLQDKTGLLSYRRNLYITDGCPKSYFVRNGISHHHRQCYC